MIFLNNHIFYYLQNSIFQNIDAVRSTAPLAVTFAAALLEEQREQNRKVRSYILLK